MSELKSISGSSRLPYGTLALGAEGIKNAIKSFDDACVAFPTSSFTLYNFRDPQYRTCSRDRRKSDIDNERLPPIEERPSSGTNGGTGTGPSASKGISASAGSGTTNSALSLPPATPFRRTKEGRFASAQRR